MKISNSFFRKPIIAIFFLAFRAALDVSYISKISEVYAYQGFFLDIKWQNYATSWAVLLLTLFISLRRCESISNSIFLILFAIGFIPMSSYYAMTASDTSWFILSAAFWIIVCYVSNFNFPSPKIRRPKNLIPVVVITGLFGLATWAIVVSYFGISFRLSFDDIYEIRAENTLRGVPLGGYIVPWAGKVALPTLAILGLRRGGIGGNIIFAAALLMESMIFATTGHKAFLFSMVLMVAFYFLAANRSRLVAIAGGLFGVVAACFLVDSLLGNTVWSGLITRRAFFVPASLSNAYYQFFDGNFMYLSHSILSPWIENPFNMPPSVAIGQQFFGSNTLNANNGVVGDGFMNFGVAGVFVWALLTGLVISFYESISRAIDKRIAFAVGISVFLTLINGGLLVTLMTHGVLFAFFIVLLCPSDIKANRDCERARRQRETA